MILSFILISFATQRIELGVRIHKGAESLGIHKIGPILKQFDSWLFFFKSQQYKRETERSFWIWMVDSCCRWMIQEEWAFEVLYDGWVWQVVFPWHRTVVRIQALHSACRWRVPCREGRLGCSLRSFIEKPRFLTQQDSMVNEIWIKRTWAPI